MLDYAVDQRTRAGQSLRLNEVQVVEMPFELADLEETGEATRFLIAGVDEGRRVGLHDEQLVGLSLLLECLEQLGHW